MPKELDEKQLAKLQRVISILDPDAMTTEEFKKHFKMVMDFVKKLKENNDAYLGDLETRYDEIVGNIKNNYGGDIAGIKGELSGFTQAELKKIREIVDKKLSEVQDGRDGLDADEEMIIETATKQATANATENIKPLIPKIEDIENDLPKLGEKIRDGLELLDGKERLGIDAIHELKEKLEELKRGVSQANSRVSGGSTGAKVVSYYDLSSQLDGTTKSFTLPSMWKIIAIHLSSFPNIMRPTVDYTYDAGTNTLTFTSEIDAATTLQSGQTLIITYASTV